jgi:hypothetical protein
VLAQVAVGVAVGGDGDADAGHDEAVRLAGGVLCDDGKDDFAMVEIGEALFARDDFALRGEDGGDADEILRGDARIPKGQLEGRQTFLVSTDTLGKEKLLRDHAFSQFLCTLHAIESRDIFFSSRMSLSHPGGQKQEGL